MKGYSTYWRTTIFAAIAFHVLTASGFSYILPYLTPAPKIENVAEFEWIDVDLSENVAVIEEEAIPQDVSPQETLPLFNPQDLVLPELNIPEPIIEETPLPEIKPIERPKPKPPQIVNNEPDATKKIENEEPPKESAIVPVNTKQLMSKPPVTVKEVCPEKGSGLGYKGYITIVVKIGKDGKVTDSQIVQTSGRMFVDEIARKAAMQWTFKPALDQNSRPMVCDKVITFDFKKFS